MVSGQWMLSVLRRQLFMNTCTFLMMVVVVLQVSAPYSRTALTFKLKILTLMLVDSCFKFHMFFNCRNAVLDLPILALFIDYAFQVCEEFHIFQSFAIKSDWIDVLRFEFEDLGFSLVYVET
ncbi:unnamed protein product [Schistosoma margrebowiei]|uniref:Uncharacterized protein n=1 Tax=Schistosoma margrebowiei TaxID=48269 RepID=A0A183MBX3_9TREM|nr:unnamed protein product [Schistosoma margrebowiei]